MEFLGKPKFLSTCRATILNCKSKSITAHITTYVASCAKCYTRLNSSTSRNINMLLQLATEVVINTIMIFNLQYNNVGQQV